MALSPGVERSQWKGWLGSCHNTTKAKGKISLRTGVGSPPGGELQKNGGDEATRCLDKTVERRII